MPPLPRLVGPHWRHQFRQRRCPPSPQPVSPPTAAASGTARADETLLTPTTDHNAEIFFNAAALSDINAVATPANRLAPASTSAMVTNTDCAGGGSGSGSARTLTLPGPKTITGPAYRPIREALASQLLVNRAHIVVGRNKKNGWLDFYNKTLGITLSHQPAMMAAYKPYANETPVRGHGIGGKDIPIMAHLAKARRWSKQ